MLQRPMLDFEQTSLDELVQPAILVTIICEAVLKDSVVDLLRNLKVKGYSVSAVEGAGRYEAIGGTSSETDEIGTETLVKDSVATNVEIRAIVSKELSNVVLYALKEQQRHFAITAYRQTVEALSEG
jgi:nitrogen regulatory protein PII